MLARIYSILFVALLSSGCTNAPFHSSVGSYAATTSDERRDTAGSEFVRANAEVDSTQITSIVLSEPSPVVADEHFVNYHPMWGSDLRRLPPVKSSDAMLVDGPFEGSRAYGDEQRPRSSLIPTQWDDVMHLIPTRWDARAVFAGQGESQLPGPPASHAR